MKHIAVAERCLGRRGLINQESGKMQYETVDEAKLTAQRLRPLVLVVIAAKLAVSVLLLTTVQLPPDANTPDVVALR
ncbi:hypothetical protein AU381_21700 [Sinorhizobium glycinis]|uniref:Uncharacterized protein n=2 Tax=Sinorhizobium glycinis TaxID=1472378 RepID=A0A178XSN8_9HYPH|nr:hypothetical protein AU381_21700 [Sinorhizobium glycinis]